MNRNTFALGALFFLVVSCSEPEQQSELAPRNAETFLVEQSANRSAPIYSGTLRAKQRSALSFLRTGQVIEMKKDLGDEFVRGEILARIDNTELSLAVEQLNASLAEVRAELADAQLSYDRLFALKGTGAVSGSVIDAAVARLDGAKARATGTEASIGQANKRLSETVLMAPFDGQIVERLIEPSQTAAAGQAVYRVIGNDGGLEAVVNLPVSALDLFVEGYRTQIRVQPSGSERVASVIEVGNAAGRSGLYPITLALEDSVGLRSGLRIEVPGLADNRANRAITIPLTAYQTASDSVGDVFLVDPDSGLVAIRKVELGRITDQGIEILSGIEPGDLIVARGLPSLRDGDIVSPLGVGTKKFNE